MLEYIPQIKDNPKVIQEYSLGTSAWGNIPTILKDIITRFGTSIS
jgi:hypothetical protein